MREPRAILWTVVALSGAFAGCSNVEESPPKKPRPRDLSDLWSAISLGLDAAWEPRPGVFGELEIRGFARDVFPRSRVDEVVRELLGGGCLFLSLRAAPLDRQIQICLLEFASEPGADRYLQFSLEQQREQDRRLFLPETSLLDATYGKLSFPGVRDSIDARRVISIRGKRIRIRDATFLAGEFVVRIIGSAEDVDRDFDRLAGEAISCLGRK